MIVRNLADDGLITPYVGRWSLRKYELMHHYANMFATAMRNKWDCRAYLDVFAGAGRAKIKGTNEIVAGSPFLALNVEHPFDRYIFCEVDTEKSDALQTRVQRDFPNENVYILEKDANIAAKEIISYVPTSSPDYRVLCFCMVDPYKMGNLNFSLIQHLATQRMDFLVLVPTYMDANRNLMPYSTDRNQTVENFLGNPFWRNDWNSAELNGLRFGQFIVDNFGKQMQKLGYIDAGLDGSVLVRRSDKLIPLYHLAFYSQHKLGMEFWHKSKKGTNPQLTLPGLE